jgi:sugar lactone lactonase YvrE
MIRSTLETCGRAFVFTAAILASSNATPFAQSFLPAYEKGTGEFVVDYTIGGDIEDEDYFLARPIDLALDAEGNLFVLDSGNYCIKKFDPEGKLLKTFGRQGEGPGEMAGPIAIETYRDGRVFLNDYRNRRFTVFDHEGNCLETRDLTDFGWRFVADVRIDGEGRLYIQTTMTVFADIQPKTQVRVSRLALDSMAEAMIDSATFRQSYSKVTDQGSIMVTAPFHPELLWRLGRDGDVVVANSADYMIRIYAPDLTLRREIRYDGEQRPVTKMDKEEYFAAFKDEELVAWMRGNVDFPKYQPYFDRMMTDSDGYILLLVDDDEEIDQQIFDVFTPEGDFLNRVSLPRMHRNAILSDGFLYTITRGDEDPVVGRYHLK